MRHFKGYRRRGGYVSLLAVSFAFGLATLGSVLAVSERSYISAAVGRERTIIDRISLESAIVRHTGELAAGRAQSLAPHDLAPLVLNGRVVSMEISLPEAKWDLAMDSREPLETALEKAGLPNGLALAASSSDLGLAELGKHLGLSSEDQDILRHAFTLGRAPEPIMPDAEAQEFRTLRPGDQIDARASVARSDKTLVQWSRVRFVGGEVSWLVHDSSVTQIATKSARESR